MPLHRSPIVSFSNAGSLLVVALLCAASLKTVRASDISDGAMPAIPQAPGIVSLTLSPATIAGGSGDTSTGTVTLNAPAPAGGAVVTLASSNIELAATMPSVTVPAGATSATFTVATNAHYRPYSGLAFNATISATHPGSTRSATLNVTAQPRPPDFSSGSQARRQHAVERVDVRRHRADRRQHRNSLRVLAGQRHRASAPARSGRSAASAASACRRAAARSTTSAPPAARTRSRSAATTSSAATACPRTIVAEAPAGAPGSGTGRAGRHRPEVQRHLFPAAAAASASRLARRACPSRSRPRTCRRSSSSTSRASGSTPRSRRS